jgi:hypothetical protein
MLATRGCLPFTRKEGNTQSPGAEYGVRSFQRSMNSDNKGCSGTGPLEALLFGKLPGFFAFLVIPAPMFPEHVIGAAGQTTVRARPDRACGNSVLPTRHLVASPDQVPGPSDDSRLRPHP